MMGSSGAESAGAVSDDVLHSRTGAESQEAGGAGGTQGFGVREVERPTDGLGRVYRVLELEVVYEVVFSNDVLHSRTGAESQEAGGAGGTQRFGVGEVERPTDGLGRALAPRESAVPGAAPRLQDPVQGAATDSVPASEAPVISDEQEQASAFLAAVLAASAADKRRTLVFSAPVELPTVS